MAGKVEVPLNVMITWKEGAFSRNFQHLALHLAKIAGEASRMAERMDHGEYIEWSDFELKRVPDLVILAAMIARDRGMSLQQTVENRIKQITETGQ